MKMERREIGRKMDFIEPNFKGSQACSQCETIHNAVTLCCLIRCTCGKENPRMHCNKLSLGSVVSLQRQCLKNGCYDVENVTLDLRVLIFMHETQKQQTDMGTFKCLYGKSIEEDSGNGKSRHGGQCEGPQESHSGY